MSQIQTKFIADSAVDESKIKLTNDSFLLARNFADSGDISMFKVNASDKVEIGADLQMSSFNILTSGNVDGRDVSADGAALDSHLDGGASKHDASEVDYEQVDGSKKDIQASSDDVENALRDLDDNKISKTGSIAFTGAQSMGGFKITNLGTPTASTDAATKGYVDSAAGTVGEWQNSAFDYIVDNTADPTSNEVSGRRLILSHDGGAPHANYDGASAGSIVEFNGSLWVETVPATGYFISADDEPSLLYYWGGSAWAQKYFETTTASTGLVKVGFDVRLDSSSAGDGLGFSAGVLAVNVDSSTIKIASDQLQGLKAKKEIKTLIAGDITNQYIDLGFVAESDSINLVVSGLTHREGSDYTVNLTGGAGGVTRITFSGDLATGGNSALIAGDSLYISYNCFV